MSKYIDEEYLLHVLMYAWSLAFWVALILLPCWIVGSVYSRNIVEWIAPQPVRTEIRKIEPPKARKTELIKTDWMVRDMRVVYEIPGSRTYEVVLWCGTSGEHK